VNVAAKARATNASASEQIDSTEATGIRVRTESAGCEPMAARSPRGTKVWATAVKRAPRTMKKITSKNSAVARLTRPRSPGAAGVSSPPRLEPGARLDRPPDSVLAARPTAMATLSVIAILSPTMAQFPWKANAVETSTTGFTTGAARMKVVAA
jgi:hypothetical protein